MQTTMLKAKLHRAEVTQTLLEYEGSCGIDSDLLDKAGILENEQIQIYNVTSGTRFTTYAIRNPAGSKSITINGAAAHLAKEGDIVIICAYAIYDEAELKSYSPKVVYLHECNQVKHTRS